MVLLNSFITSMYKKATNKLHFKVGIMMETIYNFVKKKKSGRPVEYFFYRTGYRKQTYY